MTVWVAYVQLGAVVRSMCLWRDKELTSRSLPALLAGDAKAAQSKDG